MTQASCLWGPLLLMMVVACDQQQVRTYRVPKDGSPPGQTQAPRVARIVWEKPPGWEQMPAGPMRAASFAIHGPDDQHAEASIVPLSDHSGSDLDNLNRWRSQLGLPPAGPEELEKYVQSIEIKGETIKLVEIASAPSDERRASRMIVAMVRRGGTTWFFKMMGDDLLVAAQKPAFISFLGTVKYGD